MTNDRRILIRGNDEFFGEPIGTIQTDGSVIQWVTLTNTTGASITEQLGDGSSGSPDALNTNAHNRLYNGSSFDRQRSNTEETFLGAFLRNATTNSADFINWNAKGMHVIINVFGIVNTPSITPFIQGKETISGDYYDILEGLPITTVGINIIKVFPGISAVVNVSASDILPRNYRLRIEHANGDDITYSVTGELVV